MRSLIILINGLVGGGGAWAYLEAETWAGSMFIAVLAGLIICYGESVRRTLNQ